MANLAVKAHGRVIMSIDGRGYALPAEPEAKTDGAGRFTLAGLPNGYAQVWANAPGHFQVDSLKVHAVPAQDTLRVQLVATGTISGTVIDATGNPVTDGTISATPPGDPIGKWGGSMNIKGDGTFLFENVPPGKYSISTKPQYPGAPADPNAQEVTVTSGKTTDVTVEKAAEPAPRKPAKPARLR
jgi:hypothetical protein